MRIKNINNSGFSLLEILLASIIFIISIGGVFVTLSAVRKPVADKESALAAAVFGKQVLEALRNQVNAGTFYSQCTVNANNACPDFDLYLGNHQVSSATLSGVGLSWPSTALSNANLISGNPMLTYTVTCGDGSANQGSNPSLYCTNADVARKVSLSINWTNAT